MEFPTKQNPFQLHKLKILVSCMNKYETGTDLALYLRMSRPCTVTLQVTSKTTRFSVKNQKFLKKFNQRFDEFFDARTAVFVKVHIF